jgi:hypothetical protein
MLNDYLCFSHDFRQTHFIIWQMREFGWIKISYDNLSVRSYSRLGLVPLCLLEKNNTLLLSEMGSRALLYNWRDTRAKFIDQPSGLFNELLFRLFLTYLYYLCLNRKLFSFNSDFFEFVLNLSWIHANICDESTS